MRFAVLLSLVLLAGVTTPPVAARDPLVLAPSSAWNLRYEADQCRLIRVYGEGEERVEMNIMQSGVEPYFNLFLVGQPTKTNNRQTSLDVQFGPDEEAQERSFIKGGLKEQKLPFLIMYGVPLGNPEMEEEEGTFPVSGIGAEREAAIEWLAIGDRPTSALRLPLPGFAEALAELQKCSEDLVKQLGLDSDGQQMIAKKARMTNQREVALVLLSQLEPAETHVGGSVKVRMVVNKDGKATACQVARSSRPALYDSDICLAMMQRGEFEPAVDNDGNRTASFVFMEFTIRD